MSRDLAIRLAVPLVVAVAVAACAPVPPPPTPAGEIPTESPASPRETPISSIPGSLRQFRPDPAIVPIGMAFWDAHHGIVVGSPSGDRMKGPGVVALTDDGGRTWTGGPATTAPLFAVSVAGDHDAWAIASCSEPEFDPSGDCLATAIFDSPDGGYNWRPRGQHAYLVTFADPVHGWIATTGEVDPPERLSETHDGGFHWWPIRRPCTPSWPKVASMRFVDDRHGWIVCGGEGSGTMGPNATYETLDGGMTWHLRSALSLGGAGVRVRRPPSGPIVGAFFLPSGRAWVWQGRSGTEMSLDGGLTWDQSPPGKPEEVFVDPMWFVNDQVGFALVSLEGGVTQLWSSADGGKTWKSVHRW
jgi:photosystem II stability/assembly factor-like uncharacterized protein